MDHVQLSIFDYLKERDRQEPQEELKKPPFWDGFGEELAPPPNETNHIIEVDPCQ